MRENVKTIEEFFVLFDKVATDFKWKLRPGCTYPERILLRVANDTGFCPIEALFGEYGAFSLTIGWSKFVRDAVINSADDRLGLNRGVRERLLKICGLEDPIVDGNK